FNVKLNDQHGRWYDFATGDRGGILDLVQRARGCDRVTALRWLSDFAGIPVENRPLTLGERQARARHQAELERDLPEARLWRRSASLMCDETLALLKSSIFDPNADDAGPADVGKIEQFALALKGKDDAALVLGYRSWRENHPALTAGMVWAAQKRE